MRQLLLALTLVIMANTSREARAEWAGPLDALVSRPPNDAWLIERVAKLSSEDFAEREAAQMEIERAPGLTLEQIEQVLESKDVGAEARLRLESIGLNVFRKRERAALGVQWPADSFRIDGLEISGPARATQGRPDFDSVKVLMRGDVIVKLDGLPVAVSDSVATNQNNCRAMIMSHDPGDEVELEVLRQEQPVVVRLRMGKYADLTQFNVAVQDDVLPRAWEYRRTRLSKRNGLGDDVIAAGLSASDWNRLFDAMEASQEQVFNQNIAKGDTLPLPALKAAGRGGVLDQGAVQQFRVGEEDAMFREEKLLKARLSALLTARLKFQNQLKAMAPGPSRDKMVKQQEENEARIREIGNMLARSRAKMQRVTP